MNKSIFWINIFLPQRKFMRITGDSQLNFGAYKFKFQPEILKLDKVTGEYSPVRINFIELNLSNPKDMDVLKELSNKWDNSPIVNNIYYNAQCAIKKRFNHKRFYAISEQTEDIESNPNSEMILSLAEMAAVMRKKWGYLNNIQAKSKFEPVGKYKKVGEGLLDGLKSEYNYIETYPLPTEKVLEFYQRNGFSKTEDEVFYKWTV